MPAIVKYQMVLKYVPRTEMKNEQEQNLDERWSLI